jgi:uncharacterized membrane-anchored protein YhcB (DUF1043 family)
MIVGIVIGFVIGIAVGLAVNHFFPEKYDKATSKVADEIESKLRGD